MPRPPRASAASTASPNSVVVAVPPTSGVGVEASARVDRRARRGARAPARRARARARGRASAASRSGSRAPVPAMSGAEPCTGSKMPGPPSPRLAEAARPSPPVTAAATSERMSPKVFSITSTSKRLGSVTICIATAVDERRGAARRRGSRPRPRSTTRRHIREVSSTFALSTESSRPPRARASSNARRATRSIWLGWYSQRVEDGAVVARAARAVVEAADELAHDQQVDPVAERRAEVRVDVELAAQADQARPRAARRRRPTSARRPRRAARRRPRGTRRASPPAAGRRPRRSRRRRRGAPRPRASSGSASSTRTASAITSGPIPSPGRQTMRLLAMRAPAGSGRARSA